MVNESLSLKRLPQSLKESVINPLPKVKNTVESTGL